MLVGNSVEEVIVQFPIAGHPGTFVRVNALILALFLKNVYENSPCFVLGSSLNENSLLITKPVLEPAPKLEFELDEKKAGSPVPDTPPVVEDSPLGNGKNRFGNLTSPSPVSVHACPLLRHQSSVLLVVRSIYGAAGLYVNPDKEVNVDDPL